jgi:hypothetical protein
MDDSTTSSARTSLAGLAAGLLSDLQTLSMQELRLASDEYREQLGKAKTAGMSLGLGLGLVAIGGLLLILMTVHVLSALGLPLWASFGLVGALLLGSAVYLLLRAKTKAGEIHVVPVRTVQTLKENVAWIKEEVTSART